MVFENVSITDKFVLILKELPFIVNYIYRITIKNALPVIKNTSNWWDIYLVSLNKKKSATISLKNGKKFELSKKNYAQFRNELEIYRAPEDMKKKLKMSFDGKFVTFNAPKKIIANKIGAMGFALELYEDPHSSINVKQKTVIDIGAYVADTAIYYTLIGGARHVYTFELNPAVYRIAVDNVKRNKLSKKITVINEGASGSADYIKLDDWNEKRRIRARNLDYIVEKYKINGGILKIDIEGDERILIKNASSNAIQKFDALHIEYHYGYLDMVERLKKEGYVVKYTAPYIDFAIPFRKQMVKGDIIAKKR